MTTSRWPPTVAGVLGVVAGVSALSFARASQAALGLACGDDIDVTVMLVVAGSVGFAAAMRTKRLDRALPWTVAAALAGFLGQAIASGHASSRSRLAIAAVQALLVAVALLASRPVPGWRKPRTGYRIPDRKPGLPRLTERRLERP